MKYLQIFERFFYNDDQYYKLISSDDFYSEIYDRGDDREDSDIKWIDFNDREIKAIKKLTRPKGVSLTRETPRKTDEFRWFKFSLSRSHKTLLNGGVDGSKHYQINLDKYRDKNESPYIDGIERNIHIYKLNDEWYYVRDTRYTIPKDNSERQLYYKCDGFQGLIKLLKNFIK